MVQPLTGLVRVDHSSLAAGRVWCDAVLFTASSSASAQENANIEAVSLEDR